ncbi:sel1 repeat family protein [Providencia rettgeri]|uniref:Sel1 repeat family protein n=1 Tax=Providencia rettgeri TaxID=587 RepID=A0AAP2JZX7_PRORE|nr:tetratricopeptide repeat protein [Providencia rettgeri]HCI95868.1 hypothetical protein [Providencia sp.]EJD6374578.1 sel1 repeat family protein [Providencia rettgeri]MBX6951950.1 sel1 repeat family protein [Providencia rettgeri]MBX6955573.1 sel1 repeat family protein [Providencia rettgeri]MBX6961919.1 sel1 repeat family protein [Providencia rettgeri]
MIALSYPLNSIYKKYANKPSDPMAQFYLAEMYFEGKGVSKNYSRAIEWYIKSANQGYADAQLELGYLYYYGDVIKQDKDKASELFKKACLNGIEDYDELCAEWR